MSSPNTTLPSFFYPSDNFLQNQDSASDNNNKYDEPNIYYIDTNNHQGNNNNISNNNRNYNSYKNNYPQKGQNMDYLSPAYSNPAFIPDEGSCEKEKQSGRLSRKNLHKQLSSLQSEISHQKFNDQQKEKLRSFSSANYIPAHSITYVRWMKIHRSNILARLDLDRWFLILLTGVAIGLVATLLKQCISGLNNWQWTLTRSYINAGSPGTGFAYLAGTNALMVFVGAVLVTRFHPMAMGGGATEIIAFLNGIRMHGILSVKNLLTKFSANILAVGSGLPAAIQGPLITYGAIIGAGIGQFQSTPFNLSPDTFSRFRNAEDRRAFTTSGVAAGVSAGFNSPIGGLLFAMEDLSSHWSRGLSWQTFFCCVVATTVAQLFNTAFSSFKYRSSFGFFYLSVVLPIRMHVIIIFPAILLGIIGGLLGVLFTRATVFIGACRKLMLSKIRNEKTRLFLRIIEPCIIVVIMTVYTVFLPLGFPCKSTDMLKRGSENNNFTENHLDSIDFISYANCEKKNGTTFVNPMATLIQGGGTSYLDILWSRQTYYALDYTVCLSAFVIYFPLTIWTSSSAIAGGIFVPILVSGSLLGRALGVMFVYGHRAATGSPFPSEMFSWIDPGVVAAVGAAALLSGVNRLEVASTVIVMEMVGDINLVVPVLIAIFVSKTIASKLSKPLYKYQMEGKALPFLDSDPQIVIHGKISNMELWRARDIMASPVIPIESTVSVQKVSRMLLDTNHSSFPVVKYDEVAKFEVVHGIITRNELYSLMCNDEVYKSYHENTATDSVIEPKIPYEELESHTVSNLPRVIEVLKSYTMKKDANTKINLDLYVSMSISKVDQNFSLLRTYRLFRMMGLRQLLVIDPRNKPVGIITRKDLMQFHIQEKLENLIGQEIPDDGLSSTNYLAIPGQGVVPMRGRRMSRKFSIEEGSILGTLMMPSEVPDKDSDEPMIELPAVTRVKKKIMETITEEEQSSNEAGKAGDKTEIKNDSEEDDDDEEREDDFTEEPKKYRNQFIENVEVNNNDETVENLNTPEDTNQKNIETPNSIPPTPPPPTEGFVIPTIIVEDENEVRKRMYERLNRFPNRLNGVGKEKMNDHRL